MDIKIFGERNTGTNLLRKIILNNSESNVYPGTVKEISPTYHKKLFSGLKKNIIKREDKIDKFFRNKSLLEKWKHTATNFELDNNLKDVHFIFLTRDPLSWLIGLYKNPYHIKQVKPKTLVEFSKLDWIVLERDNLPNNFYKPIDMYINKLNSYKEFIFKLQKSNLTFSILQFEALVTDQFSIFNSIKKYLTLPVENFEFYQDSTKDKSKNYDFYQTYYKNSLWKDDFPEHTKIDLANDEIFTYFGY